MKTFCHFVLLTALCLVGGVVHAANFRTVVIDAGHGGHDNGGQWGLVYEKHLALDTAYRKGFHAHLEFTTAGDAIALSELTCA